jgi:uncharacterized protein
VLFDVVLLALTASSKVAVQASAKELRRLSAMDGVKADNMEALIPVVRKRVEEYMSHYDASHDFQHILRVVHSAHRIYDSMDTSGMSRDIVTLAALLHDVGDRKYIKPDEDPARLVHDLLRSIGASETVAAQVQAICLGVSYSSEVKDPERVRRLIEQYPELAIVQDADRLDAIGAVGIGRVFTFGGATNRSLADSMEHFDEKLVKVEGMMKTSVGKQLAGERTERLRKMQEWWAEETSGLDQ